MAARTGAAATAPGPEQRSALAHPAAVASGRPGRAQTSSRASPPRPHLRMSVRRWLMRLTASAREVGLLRTLASRLNTSAPDHGPNFRGSGCRGLRERREGLCDRFAFEASRPSSLTCRPEALPIGRGGSVSALAAERPSLATSGETLTIEESMTLRARMENAGYGDEHEWSWGSG